MPYSRLRSRRRIPLFESFTQLYDVWKDDAVRKRIEELLAITRDKVCVEPGAMNPYFTNAWQPIPDHDSYGHDVEAAYLMLEAEDVLGDTHNPAIERMAKMLVDHALAYRWDQVYGGFYRDGTTIGRAEDKLKQWWLQVEGLNALLIMHKSMDGKAICTLRLSSRSGSSSRNIKSIPSFMVCTKWSLRMGSLRFRARANLEGGVSRRPRVSERQRAPAETGREIGPIMLGFPICYFWMQKTSLGSLTGA